MIIEEGIVRVLKPIAFSFVAFGSSYYLSRSMFAASVIASIPLILGWLSILQGFSYGLTALLFLVASAWAIIPTNIKIFLEQQTAVVIKDVNEHIAEPNDSKLQDGL